MDVRQIAIDKHRARELYQKYKTHQHYETDQDREIKRTYQLIAQGKIIIQALDAVRQAGVDERDLPKLALSRATAKTCEVRMEPNGSAMMFDPERPNPDWDKRVKDVLRWPARTFVARERRVRARGALPIIPIHLRPKRGLASYHILWEAEWSNIAPVDPYLLRRIGKADLWLVCAAWDLTDVERAAMATRISVN